MEMMVLIAVLIAVGTTLYGVRAFKIKQVGNVRKALFTSVSLFSMALVGVFAFVVFGSPVMAVEAAGEVANGVGIGEGLKSLAAALSTGLATIGAGMAVGSVGSAAIGAVSEDPSILGKTLIFVGLAEGIAIYGIIISIIILFV